MDLTTLPALMLLVDGRFPAGTHAHSGGFEAAAAGEGVDDVPGLARFLEGRLATAGLVAAAFAAAACARFPGELGVLDAEFDARTPSPVLRTVSRRLGRQLVRTGRKVWPHPGLDELASVAGSGLHQPVAFGAVAAAAGQAPELVATAVAQESIAGPAMASVRLLGLDPFEVHALLARLAPEVVAVAAEGAGHAGADPEELPSRAGYLLDISAEIHATWEVRLFAS